MKWQRKVAPEDLKAFDTILLAAIALLITGLVTQEVLPYLITAILTAHLLLSKVFDRNVVKNLHINNDKQTIRMFPEEESDLTITLKNNMHLPLVHGELTFRIGHQLAVKNQMIDEASEMASTVSIPASLSRKKQVELTIPVKALSRGTVRITRLSYQYMHYFGFYRDAIHFSEPFQKEFIIYPALKKVEGIQSVFHYHPGSARLRHSPFEDTQDIIGTRDYISSDSFQRINWKASARSQQLQTNVYQRVADRSFVFLVNLQTGLKAGAGERIEDLISYTAYLCHTAREEDQPYELIVNLLHTGNTPYLHQHAGDGHHHLAKSLELLARIPKHALIQQFNVVLYHMVKTQKLSKTILLLGDIPKDALHLLQQLRALGHHLFYVEEIEGTAKIRTLELEKIA
jgi:uncharacterized protein (DUF58 family)